MEVAALFYICFAVFWGVAVGFFCLTFLLALVQPYVQARRTTQRQNPPISIIVPLKLLDSGFIAAQTSVFLQKYEDFEVLFSAAEPDSPASAAIVALAKTYPGVPCTFYMSQCETAVSPKLNNLARPLVAAKHDFILVKDSNIRLEPKTMANFMANFGEGTGLVVGVPVAVEPASFAGAIEACLINDHARLLLAASAIGFGFGVGKVMLFKRSDLERAGGFDAMSHSLAEDSAISKGLRRLGLRTHFADRTISQLIGPRRFRDIYERQCRWSVIRRVEEPVTFLLEPLNSPLLAAIAGSLAAPLLGLAWPLAFAATLLGFLGAELIFAVLKGWKITIDYPAAFLGREILSLIAWLRACLSSRVIWAGQDLEVRQGARKQKA